MALVTLRNIELSFGHPSLIESANLVIEQGERICLVGRNGCGKTTLLRVLQGQIKPDQGEVIKEVGIKIAALDQDVPENLEGTCFDVITGGLDERLGSKEEQSHQVDNIISRLGLQGEAIAKDLSGGLKRRVLLAKALVNEPDLLLLDEPTNHLDIESIQWLEQFLLKHKGTLLFVTHDRVFLQKLATRIIDIEDGQLKSYPGDFSSYSKKKQELLEIEQKNIEKFNRKLAEEEIWIRKGVKERRTRNEGRVRALKKMREIARSRRAKTGKASFDIHDAGRASKRVMKAKEVFFSYDDNPSIIKNLNVSIYRQDKIGIIGPNGCGKTTLLKLLLGELKPTEGETTLGENLQVAYLDQLRMQLDLQKSVIENVIEAGDKVIINGQSKHIFTYLQDFLFTPDRAKSPVWVLSGGERNRLLLAKLFTQPSNVLVLDEPTNDLDSETLELLEERIIEYPGTVMVVSHDRAFLNNAVTSTLVFEQNEIGEYVGGYDDWLSQREAVEKEVAPKKKKAPRVKPKGPRKLTFKEKFELEALPKTIETLEDEQAALHEKMADPEFYKNSGDEIAGATVRMEEIEAELLRVYARWEELENIKEQSS